MENFPKKVMAFRVPSYGPDSVLISRLKFDLSFYSLN